MVEVSVYVGISFGGVVDVGGVVAVAVGGVVLLLFAVAVILTIISMISLAIAMIVFSYPPPIVLRYRAPAIVVVDSQRESERPPELNLGRLLDAIREIEGWRGRRGSAGEFGPWQIMPSVWSAHSRASPWRASLAEHRRVALAQIADIRRALADDGRDANSAFWVALGWNAGPSAVVRGTAPAKSWRYADRTRNIYDMNTMNDMTQ